MRKSHGPSAHSPVGWRTHPSRPPINDVLALAVEQKVELMLVKVSTEARFEGFGQAIEVDVFAEFGERTPAGEQMVGMASGSQSL